jgi:AraC-like DNA-binding protein
VKRVDYPYPKYYLYSRIVRAKLFIDAHYASSIALDNICDEAHFSKYHFIRLFKKIYERTPHQYLMYVRVERAKELLEKDYSVVDVCFLVGFESASSFTGLFKRTIGKTPVDYQHDYQLRQEHIRLNPLLFVPHCFARQNGWTEK